MKVYNYGFFDITKVIIDGKEIKAVFGKHEIYLPGTQEKLIFSVRGKIVSYGVCRYKDEMIANGLLFAGFEWQEKYLENIVNEYSLLKFLASKNLAPPIGDMIFIKNTFINLGDYGILDEVGMFGYEMKDVYTLPPGNFNIDVVNELFESGIIEASQGAKNDLTNTKRKNLINGYCIDVRRSFRDDLPFYNNFKFNGEKVDIWNDIRSVLNG